MKKLPACCATIALVTAFLKCTFRRNTSEVPSADVSVPVQLDGAVGESQRGRATPCVPLLDELGQESHDAQVLPAPAEAAAQQEVVRLPGLAPQGGAAGVEQGPSTQCRQGALQVQQVGGAVADVGVRVGQPAQQEAGVGRGVQRLLVQVQQRDVAAVAGERVQEGGGGGGSSGE